MWSADGSAWEGFRCGFYTSSQKHMGLFSIYIQWAFFKSLCRTPHANSPSTPRVVTMLFYELHHEIWGRLLPLYVTEWNWPQKISPKICVQNNYHSKPLSPLTRKHRLITAWPIQRLFLFKDQTAHRKTLWPQYLTPPYSLLTVPHRTLSWSHSFVSSSTENPAGQWDGRNS